MQPNRNKRPMRKIILFMIILLILGVSLAYAGELALGVGYPCFLVKYHPFELKYATGDGINVFAGRFYLNFYQGLKVRAFTGVEGGYVKFNSLDIKGSGYEGGIFIGGEYFVADNIALAIDISPTYLGLKSDDNYKASGLDIIGNVAVYYYFSAPSNKSLRSGKKIIDTDNLSTEEKAALVDKFTAKAKQYGEEGDDSKAAAIWEKVLTIDPENKTAKEEIERAKILMEEPAE